MDTYVELQDYIFYLAISMIIVILIFLVSVYTYSTVRLLILVEFFTQAGYIRKLLYDSSTDGCQYWGWFRRSDNTIVRDIDIQEWSIKQIKHKYR